MNFFKIYTCSAVVITLLFITDSSISSRNKFRYMGLQKCSQCHANDSIGNQTASWGKSPHSKSFKVLQSDAAREIGEKFSISDTSTEKRCLKCHVTGGGFSEIPPNEGVGCESCHGPGEEYISFENHASFTDRKNAYIKAVKNGMYPIIGIEHIRNREKLCMKCHTADPEIRLCLPENPEERKKDILSLDAIANFPYPHPSKK